MDNLTLQSGKPGCGLNRSVAIIQMLRKLAAEARPATQDEKALLVKYVGWGAMPQVFDVESADWRGEQVQLSEILSDREHRAARATTLNAHYTSTPLRNGA